MSKLKPIRDRLKMVESTRKITKAMQLVSTSKIRKLKLKLDASSNFTEDLTGMMRDISNMINFVDARVWGRLQESILPFVRQDLKNTVHLLVVITAQRGLCGGFDARLLKKLRADVNEIQSKGERVVLVPINKRGLTSLRRLYPGNDPHIVENAITYRKDDFQFLACKLTGYVMNRFSSITEPIGDKPRNCTVYYNKFHNVLTQVPTSAQILPVLLKAKEEGDGCVSEYEMSDAKCFDQLIKSYAESQFISALFESQLGEEAARMTAMDSATRSADDLIGKLTLDLNRSRQASITTELMEIISGTDTM